MASRNTGAFQRWIAAFAALLLALAWLRSEGRRDAMQAERERLAEENETLTRAAADGSGDLRRLRKRLHAAREKRIESDALRVEVQDLASRAQEAKEAARRREQAVIDAHRAHKERHQARYRAIARLKEDNGRWDRLIDGRGDDPSGGR